MERSAETVNLRDVVELLTKTALEIAEVIPPEVRSRITSLDALRAAATVLRDKS